MSGTPRAMFLPLTLAVGFSMIASFILSQTLVPVLANWWLKDEPLNHQDAHGRFSRFKDKLLGYTKRIFEWRRIVIPAYIVGLAGILLLLFSMIGTEIFPKIDSGQLQVRVRMPDGTRVETTEEKTKEFLSIVEEVAGKENIEITSAFVGIQPPSYPVNTIFLWTGGPHEGVVKIKLKDTKTDLDELQETLREKVPGGPGDEPGCKYLH